MNKIVLVVLAVLLSGTILFWMWPVIANGFFPKLVEQGWIPSDVPWLACVFIKWQFANVMGTEPFPWSVKIVEEE